jgi:pimeloyl-ACP methyl ester carboxylesterase
MLKDPYAYSLEGQVHRSPVSATSDFKTVEITFPSPVKTDFSENNTVYALHYIPLRKRKGLAIHVLHGWGAREARYEKGVCAALARNGFDSCLLSLPYHMKRTPRGAASGSHFFSTQLERSGHAFQQGVIDARCLGDLMIAEGMKLGCFGMSMGAILLHLLMGVDERFGIGVSVLGGGNINRMVWQGLMGRAIVKFLRTRGVSKRDFYEILEDYKFFLEEIARTGEIPEPKWEWYLLDPLSYAHRNRPRRVLMFNGYFDPIIPRASVIELHQALGQPKLVWLPTEHFTTAFFRGMIVRRSLAFLDQYVLEDSSKGEKRRN